ncbi:hypothetical protein [Kyrpidia tusciae]|uniref:Uncharacterized protein n=1 Tax=Kyrpidia tusciae (strain DSM 2912 / NBRC 15312 / T2) TaxID=562970 RepID=D5WSH0_KYRT2|nr:hypothetical protein [Kyrpidia tusciae]ADG05055.1 hypothetical protein Btus_0281 [Kyrpidia tusciae DSM 2912]
MEEVVKDRVSQLLEQWNRLQTADLESLEDDSLRFGAAFYDFVDDVRQYFESIGQIPESLDDILERLGIREALSRLPEPLSLHFANELGYILEGITPMEDATWA